MNLRSWKRYEDTNEKFENEFICAQRINKKSLDIKRIERNNLIR